MLGDGGLQVCFSGVLCLRSSLINEFITSLRHVKYMHWNFKAKLVKNETSLTTKWNPKSYDSVVKAKARISSEFPKQQQEKMLEPSLDHNLEQVSTATIN